MGVLPVRRPGRQKELDQIQDVDRAFVVDIGEAISRQMIPDG